MSDVVHEIPEAVITDNSHLSLFWIIPIIAFIIGGWLVYKVYSERGEVITITLNNAEGIDIKKTPVRYKNVTVGKVTGINLDDGLDKVLITAEIVPSMAKHLGPGTRFWAVRPQISVQGVSGLSTLLSGIYIGMDPGPSGEALSFYQGLEVPPRVTSYSHGKTFTLEASKLGAVGIGSPVYYRQINVGEVAKYELNKDNDTVSITIFIKDPYSTLVRQNTMFWNISGLDINLSATGGINARMESLTSLLIGGIAFESPQTLSRTSVVTKDSIFPLYESNTAAKDQNLGEPLYYVMYFDESLRGLTIGSPVEYRGIQMGKVEDIRLVIRKADDIKIPVLISLYADKLSLDGDLDDAKDHVYDLVKKGMFGQLNTSSLLTGAQHISLTFPKEKLPGMIKVDSENTLGINYEELPTIEGSMSHLTERAVDILDNIQGGVVDARSLIKSVDVSKIVDGIAAGIADARALINSPEIKGSTQDIRVSTRQIAKILNEVHGLVRQVKPDMLKSAHHLTGTMQKAEAITGNLNREIRPLSLQVQSTLKRLDQTLSRASTTLNSANSMLSEDSSLQYELRLLIEEVSEAANSFSILANTLQRKPNSVIFGK